MNREMDKHLDGSFRQFAELMSGKGYDGMFTTRGRYPGSLMESLMEYRAACRRGEHEKMFPVYVHTCTQSQAGNGRFVLAGFLLDHSLRAGIKVRDIRVEFLESNGEIVRWKQVFLQGNGELPKKQRVNEMVLGESADQKLSIEQGIKQDMKEHIEVFAEMMNRKGYDGSFTTGAQYRGNLKDSLLLYHEAYREGIHASLFPVFISTFTKGGKESSARSVRVAFKLDYVNGEGIKVRAMLAELLDKKGQIMKDQVLDFQHNYDVPHRKKVNVGLLAEKRKRMYKL